MHQNNQCYHEIIDVAFICICGSDFVAEQDQNNPDQNKEAQNKEPQTPRESVMGSLVSSAKYLQDAHAETDVIKLRKSDRFTQLLLLIALLIMGAAMFLPDQRNICSLLADLLMAIVLSAFMALRFGVIKTLKPRQAVLTWQLILGAFLLGIYLAFNIRMFALMQTGLSIR